jgi:hypothetical protein
MKNKIKAISYKIRDKDTGLYAISISKNKWGKTGRTWSRMCDVVRVINNGIRRSRGPASAVSPHIDEISKKIMEWEIVELTESGSRSTIYYLDKFSL